MVKYIIRCNNGFQASERYDTYIEALARAQRMTAISGYEWHVVQIKVG